MAQWFKARYHSQRAASSLRVSPPKVAVRSNLDSNVANLIDSKNLSSLTSKTPWNKQDYYNQYQHSFAKGEYNTKETVYTPTGQVIRSYMSGGIGFGDPSTGSSKIITAVEQNKIAGSPARTNVLESKFQSVSVDADLRKIIIQPEASQSTVSSPVTPTAAGNTFKRISESSLTKQAASSAVEDPANNARKRSLSLEEAELVEKMFDVYNNIFSLGKTPQERAEAIQEDFFAENFTRSTPFLLSLITSLISTISFLTISAFALKGRVSIEVWGLTSLYLLPIAWVSNRLAGRLSPLGLHDPRTGKVSLSLTSLEANGDSYQAETFLTIGHELAHKLGLPRHRLLANAYALVALQKIKSGAWLSEMQFTIHNAFSLVESVMAFTDDQALREVMIRKISKEPAWMKRFNEIKNYSDRHELMQQVFTQIKDEDYPLPQIESEDDSPYVYGYGMKMGILAILSYTDIDDALRYLYRLGETEESALESEELSLHERQRRSSSAVGYKNSSRTWQINKLVLTSILSVLITATPLVQPLFAAGPRHKTKPAPIAYVSPQDLQTRLSQSRLFTMPLSSTLLILKECSPSLQVSFFDLLYKWYEAKHPLVSLEEFEDLIRGMGSVGLQRMFKQYLTEEGRSNDVFARSELEYSLRIISSVEFTELLAELEKNYNINDAANPAYEAFSILNNSGDQKTRYLSALRSAEFKEFCSFLRMKYKINPANNIRKVLDIYLNPVSLAKYRAGPDNLERVIDLFRKYLPHSLLDTIGSLDFLNRVFSMNPDQMQALNNGQLEQRLIRISAAYNELVAIYGLIVVNPENDLSTVFWDSFENTVNALQSPKVQQDRRYYETHYLNKTGVVTMNYLFDYGFLRHYIEVSSLKRVAVEKFDEFLQIFGLNLSTVSLSQIDEINFGANPGAFINKLISNEDFKKFVTNLLTKYPALKAQLFSGSCWEVISNIITAYNNKSAFDKINADSNSAGKRALPIFVFKNSEQLLEVARVVKEKFPQIILWQHANSNHEVLWARGISDSRDPEEAVMRILVLLSSDRAQRVYQSLVEGWGFQVVPLDFLLDILKTPSKVSFILLKKNVEKFQQLRKLYSFDFGFGNPGYSRMDFYLDISGLSEIIAQFNFYARKTTVLLIKKHWGHLFKNQKNSIASFWTEVKRYSLIIHHSQFSEISMVLERDFGIRGSAALDLWIEKIPDGYLDSIKSHVVQENFRRLKTFFMTEGVKINNCNLLKMAFQIKADIQEVVNNLHILIEMGFRIKEIDFSVNVGSKDFYYFLKYIFGDKQVREDLNSQEFRSFYQMVMRVLYFGNLDIMAIPELSEIFHKTSKEQKDILASKKFDEALSFMRTRFNIT
ncbi:MAG: hypothetical protein HZC15_05695, partial [Candidatus Omnitrophica bacterium]|nr:hypothetical protein [Candidatus Omnitrophota bacterium]